MKNLFDIIKDVDVLEVQSCDLRNLEITVSSLVLDSRKASKNSLFFAVKGEQADGHLFIDKAIENGATVIVCETFPNALSEKTGEVLKIQRSRRTSAETRERTEVRDRVSSEVQRRDLKNLGLPVTFLRVHDVNDAIGKIASYFYDNPSQKIKLVGVTGTNGKTTIATSLYNLFRILGYKTGLLSTIENKIEDEVIPSTHTTPDAIEINSLLARMVQEGCTHCFMEVSSHAIVQKRISGLTFTGGIFTNLTRDHLDYHKTFAEYLKAKKTFFDKLPKETFALTNKDDRNGEIMLEGTHAKKYRYSVKGIADFKGKIIEDTFEGLLLELDGTEVATLFVGSFNAYNLTAIYAVAILLGEEKQQTLRAISMLTPAAGRFEAITLNGINAIVDYAHTPDALENVLNTLHEIRQPSQQIICVVGAGGNRDKGKRPIMASTAYKLSDKLILTSDNPRNENPTDIINDMLQGLTAQERQKTLAITDRKEAIKTAGSLANKGDIILVAGKGHETYQEINGVKHHFDDKEEITNTLQ